MTTSTAAIAAPRTRSMRLRRRPADVALWASAATCVVLLLMALLGPALAPHAPNQIDPLSINQGPSAEHWLGTDALGRDVASRILHGARLSLLGPLIIVAGATVIGTALALAAAWIGGRFDRALNRVFSVIFAFPGLLIALIAVVLFGPGLVAPIIALTIAYIPYMARIVRSVALRERGLAYVDASYLLGAPAWKICSRHILPNVQGMVWAQAAIAFGSALVELAAISFLGLGVAPPASEWGLMITEARADLLNGHAHVALAASVAVIIAVISFNVLGGRLAARLGGES